MATPFAYSNHPTSPPGRLVRWGGRVLPGVRAVQAQVAPWAQAWEQHNAGAVAGDGPWWLVLGDSMAQGVGAGRWDGGWPGRVRELVPAAAALRMVNLSVYGAGVADVVTTQLDAAAELTSAQGPPALVTCVIGSNDLIGRARRAALPDALEALLARVPEGSVIASQPQGRPGTVDFNRRLDAAAARRGLLVAEFRDPRSVDWRGGISRDLFHPNDRGYLAMGRVFADPVRRALTS